MESSSTFKRISSANREIEKIPASLRSHISSPKSPSNRKQAALASVPGVELHFWSSQQFRVVFCGKNANFCDPITCIFTFLYTRNTRKQAILARILSGDMKSLVLFAVAFLFGSVHCDQECFGAAVKECMMDPVPSERMRLCDEAKYQIECLSRMLSKCSFQIWITSVELKSGINLICIDSIKECKKLHCLTNEFS
ncbi:hypothetical protein AVEN_224079-1 [Araneus ventricosus]|uniref:Uncharacterized protein n=1 Tax=Araneus ventricosus TaxID=182803 RepID=A0A4Y2IVY1_ARAVE|nr:hypothetical protein AVEN_224079-1 [Araneus ventricosus]